jgi:hypothetical protein
MPTRDSAPWVRPLAIEAATIGIVLPHLCRDALSTDFGTATTLEQRTIGG